MNSLVLLGAGGLLLYLMSGKKESNKEQKNNSSENQIYSFDPNSIQLQPNKPNNGSLGSLNSSSSNSSGNSSSFGSSGSNFGILTPKNTPNKGTFGLKSNPLSAYNKIIVKKVATPGYFYKISLNDSMYSDPLMKIAVVAYGLMNVPDNVILNYSRQLNANDYNIRFQHYLSNNYLPFNKRIDTSPVYGTLKQQFDDSAQGSYRKGNNFPTIYIPLEDEFK